MANSPSARKRVRQNEARRSRNRHHRSTLRSAIRKLRVAIASGDRKIAQAQLPGTIGIIDRMAGRRIVHPNTAARTKSRLMRLLAGLDGGGDPTSARR